jgi:hypothetical protein
LESSNAIGYLTKYKNKTLPVSLAADSRYRLLTLLRVPLVALLPTSSNPEDSEFSSSSKDATIEATLSLGALNPPSTLDSARFAIASTSSPITSQHNKKQLLNINHVGILSIRISGRKELGF